MKKSIFILAIFTTLSLFTACSAGYVSTEPTYQETQTPRPTVRHIWVEGNWVWNRQSRSYQHAAGLWVIPHQNRIYQRGHWVRTNRGSRWQKGRWY